MGRAFIDILRCAYRATMDEEGPRGWNLEVTPYHSIGQESTYGAELWNWKPLMVEIQRTYLSSHITWMALFDIYQVQKYCDKFRGELFVAIYVWV